MDCAKEIIDIIDKRIDTYLKSSNCLRRYSGQVVGLEANNFCRIKLLGYDTVYSFPMRPYLNPNPGDYVLIESKIGNISNGIVTDILNKDI